MSAASPQRLAGTRPPSISASYLVGDACGHVGADDAGAHLEHGDALRREPQRQALRPHRKPGLGDAVVGPLGRGHLGADRGDGDDRARPARRDAASIAVATAWVRKNGAAQIDAITRSKFSGSARAGRRAPTAPMPALLTRQSMRPNRSTIAATTGGMAVEIGDVAMRKNRRARPARRARSASSSPRRRCR